MPPLVCAKFDKRPLGEALKKLADDTPWSLVLDARVGDKAKLEITTTLKSVPLDTAVRILADMADLQPVIMDNVIYVTTRENAARLEADHLKRQPAVEPQPKKPKEEKK